ncbi:MAG: hypothetical protein M3Z35_14030 [Nitrospirota bacterium]|nr:hypothetical protein [Nitrospirota bacterium]
MANAKDTFARAYQADIAANADASSERLVAACCALVRQLKSDGLMPEEVLAYMKVEIAQAGGKRIESKPLNDDLIIHCIEEYYRPPVRTE